MDRPLRAKLAATLFVSLVLAGCSEAPTTPAAPDSTSSTSSTTLTTSSTTAQSTEFPSAATTGFKPGTKLTKMSGEVIRLTKPGQVLENVEINGCVTVAPTAHNAIIRNSLIKSGDCYWLLLNDEGAKNLLVEDVEFNAMDNPKTDAAVGGYNYTLNRVNIHNSTDGAKLGSNVTVKDSYIHDLSIQGDSHNDALQGLDGTNIHVTHNNMVIADGSTSAIILGVVGNESWRLDGVYIDDNLVGGGAYTIYGGYEKGNDPEGRVKNINITNNKFTTRIHPKSGVYGPLTSIDAPAVKVSGNVWYDGPNKGKPVD